MSSDKNECILIYSFEHHLIVVSPTDMFQFTKEHDENMFSNTCPSYIL